MSKKIFRNKAMAQASQYLFIRETSVILCTVIVKNKNFKWRKYLQNLQLHPSCSSINPTAPYPPTHFPAAQTHTALVSERIPAPAVLSVSECAGTHCSGHDADGATYLKRHNSPLVCHACDQSRSTTHTSDVLNRPCNYMQQCVASVYIRVCAHGG